VIAMPRILGIVMAGGRGDRLQPLTRARSKAAVPFGARHRIVDYVLSNLVNSGIYAVYLLVQYKAQSLIEHVSATWRIGGRLPETFVTVGSAHRSAWPSRRRGRRPRRRRRCGRATPGTRAPRTRSTRT